jgi:hypothetical protein
VRTCGGEAAAGSHYPQGRTKCHSEGSDESIKICLLKKVKKEL